MGKAATISWNRKYNVLKGVGVFNIDGSLRKESHPVWKEAHAKLNGLEQKTIYFDVFQNRNNLKDDLLDYFTKKNRTRIPLDEGRKTAKNSKNNSIECKKGLKLKEPSVERTAANHDEDEIIKLNAFIQLHESFEVSESNTSTDEESGPELNNECPENSDVFVSNDRDPNPQNFENFNFTIHLDEDEWRSIKPSRGLLPKYQWTSVIASHIYEYTPLRCAYIFKFGKVYKSMTDKYIDFQAYCKQTNCQTSMYGICKEKPINDENGVQFYISTYDTTSLYHHTKRPFMGSRRKEAGAKLVYISAGLYRAEMVNDLMDSDDEERPDIPSAANLRTVKVEGLRKYLRISGPRDPIKSLLFMMNEFPFIKEVCIKPFRVWYRFDSQVKLWNRLEPLNPVLKVDATGSLVKKVMINEETSAYIYLYQLITIVDNTYAPLSQMISSKHDANIINQWLNEWKSKVNVMPKEIVCDDGLAFLYGLCEALNDCTYKQYLSACLQILQGKQDIPPLMCHIGLDRAHITKSPSNWKPVKAKNSTPFLDFITRSISLASVCEKLDDVKEILLATFIIVESETMAEKSICEDKYEWLMDKFENFGINSNNVVDDKNKETDEEKLDEDAKKSDDEKKSDEVQNGPNHCEEIAPNLNNSQIEIDLHMSSNTVKDYVESIHKEALDLIKQHKVPDVNDQNQNEFYCAAITKNLVFLYAQFPAWTNVMRAYFCSPNKVATSAEIEAYFKDLKNTYNLKNVIAAHTFVMYHARIIDAQTKMARCQMMKALNLQDKETTDQEMSKLENEIASLIYDIQEENLSMQKNEKKRFDKKNKMMKKDDQQLKADVTAKIIDQEIKEQQKKDVPKLSKNRNIFHAHIRNGHLDETVTINGRELTFSNTCGFDSAISILIFAYESNFIFKNYVDENLKKNGLFFESIAGYSNRTIDMEKFYHNRGLLLLDYQTNKNTSTYNCECGVNGLLSNLLKDEISCGKIVHCVICNHRRLDKHRLLTVDDVYASNLIRDRSDDVIRRCVMNCFETEFLHCRSCRDVDAIAVATSSLGYFVAIDISKVFEDHDIPSANVPVELTVKGIRLILAGLIIRTGPKNGTGHFFAYCYDRSNAIYEIIDDCMTSSSLKKTFPRNVKITTMIYVIANEHINSEVLGGCENLQSSSQ